MIRVHRLATLVEHNVFERFGSASAFPSQGMGLLFQVAGRDCTFRHNTAWTDWSMVSLPKFGLENLVFVDNLMTPGSYGVKFDGGGVGWKAAQENHLRGNSMMAGNTLIRVGTERARSTRATWYPDGDLWFDSFEDAGVDPRAYRLRANSRVPGTATDGTDPGADIDAILKATAGVRVENG